MRKKKKGGESIKRRYNKLEDRFRGLGKGRLVFPLKQKMILRAERLIVEDVLTEDLT